MKIREMLIFSYHTYHSWKVLILKKLHWIIFFIFCCFVKGHLGFILYLSRPLLFFLAELKMKIERGREGIQQLLEAAPKRNKTLGNNNPN